MFQHLVLGRASIGAWDNNGWVAGWMDRQMEGRGREGRKKTEGGREKRGEIEWQLCEWNDG